MSARRVLAVLVFAAVLAAVFGAALAAPGGAGAAPGGILWKKPVATPFSQDDGLVDLVAGPGGSVYVLSEVHRSATDTDVVAYVTKYGEGGARKWQKSYAPAAATAVAPIALAVDAVGNAYVATTVTLADGAQARLVKFTAAGRRAWVRSWPTPSTASLGHNVFTDVACDAAGNVFACGREVAVLGAGLFVRKYSPAGAVKWSRGYGAGRRLSDGADTLAVDAKSGAVYVVGAVTSMTLPLPGSFDRDVVTAKWSATGKRLWARTWGSNGDWSDTVDAVALGASGELFIGVTVADDPGYHPAVLNYGKGGTLHWAKNDADTLPLPPSNRIDAFGVDGNDRARVTLSNSLDGDVTLRAYAAGGWVLWQHDLPLGVYQCRAWDMAVTPAGKAYLVGYVISAKYGYPDVLVMAVRPDGTTALWTTIWASPAHQADLATRVVLRQGRLFAGGWTTSSTTKDDALVMRLAP